MCNIGGGARSGWSSSSSGAEQVEKAANEDGDQQKLVRRCCSIKLVTSDLLAGNRKD